MTIDSAPDNTAIARGFFAAFFEGDFDRLFADYAEPDLKWVVTMADDPELRAVVPWSGREHVGHRGLVELQAQLLAAFEPVSFEPTRFTDAGDRVFVEGTFRLRHRMTDKIADSDWVARLDFENGRVSSGQFFENSYAVAAAMAA